MKKPRLKWRWSATGGTAKAALAMLNGMESAYGSTAVCHISKPLTGPDFHDWGAALLLPLHDGNQPWLIYRYNAGVHLDRPARVICFEALIK